MRESFKIYLKTLAFTNQSIKSRMTIINQFWKWLDKENMEGEQVGYNDLLLFMKYCQQVGRTQRTIQHYMVVVKHFYDHLLREGKVAINPATDIEIRGVKRKTLYHILEPHELHQLYNQYRDESLKGRRNKVMLGLLVYQGLQTVELAKLEVQHIKLREGKIDVPGGIKSSTREMKLEAHQVMDMYDYILQIRPQIIEQSGQQTDKLLISPAGGTELSNFMTRMMVRLRKINPTVQNAKHIRASVIVKWLKLYNLREVQYLAGHRYISTTEGYLHNEMDGLKEEVQQFHPIG
jgi:integrase/recombinase XerD